MRCDLKELKITLFKQLNSFYIITDEERLQIEKYLPIALDRAEYSFAKISNKYYSEITKDGIEVVFNYLHQCQYAQFLYFLSNSIHKGTECEKLCDKIYGLNKVVSSCDIFYQIDLPDVFFLEHPVGAVLGRAEYSNYFSFSQGCTVGGNKGSYPVLQERVFMLSDSKVIGNSNIGRNVIISANAYIKDTDIPDNSIVFGQSPNLIIKSEKKEVIDRLAGDIFKV